MSRIGPVNTVPEMIVRRILHSMGYRYRLHRKTLPGKPDIVFSGRKKAIFVHGCFWHAHGCNIGQPPKSNLQFWEDKLDRNRERDESNTVSLREQGWDVLVVWQCQTKDPVLLRSLLQDFLSDTKQALSRSATN